MRCERDKITTIKFKWSFLWRNCLWSGRAYGKQKSTPTPERWGDQYMVVLKGTLAWAAFFYWTQCDQERRTSPPHRYMMLCKREREREFLVPDSKVSHTPGYMIFVSYPPPPPPPPPPPQIASKNASEIRGASVMALRGTLICWAVN